jgi:hypothetical protein
MSQTRRSAPDWSWVPGGDGSLTPRRWKRWITYYSRRKELFGAERIFLIDDGSAREDIPPEIHAVDADGPLPDELPEGIVMFRFEQHLGRQSNERFPGWRRSFVFAHSVSEKYAFQKIIHIESDAFVLSERMARGIKELSTGWTAFECRSCGFAETALQVICRDAFPMLEQLRARGSDFWNEAALPEHTFPFTAVDGRFVGDRYGDFRPDHPWRADYVCQARPYMRFEDKLKPASPKPGGLSGSTLLAVARRFILRLAWIAKRGNPLVSSHRRRGRF